MKISIITPTHNPKFLKELEATILAQTYPNWEWVIILNNGAQYSSSDERIKIFNSPFSQASVGLLKRYASMQCTGEIIAEVDHDDLITPDCLSELADAFADNEIGFVFSDNAKLTDKFIPYDANFGWEHYTYNYKGMELIAMKSQPLTPGRFGYIWYAPDHIRAWRKDVYESINGHSESSTFCDDQELMHRLYMVTKFKHIPKVLYLYRINGDNTWLKNSAQIQTKTVELYNQNIEALAIRFAEINNLLKIDLCGGFNSPKGYTSIDKSNADIIADLEIGIPLPDNSVGIIRANDALEHIKNQQLLMKEIHRVLVPGGILLSSTPSTDGRGAFQDPTHVSFWNENSFWYWTRSIQAQYIHNKYMFRECKLSTWFPTEWHRDNNISYVVAHLEKI